MSSISSAAKDNLDRLGKNPYPGRGIVIGLSPDGRSLMQVYWIMGRSENSRNRVFVEENGFVKTKAFDEKKLTDPSLIIYYPARHTGSAHIITNGDQTDTVFESLKNGGTFESALSTRTFEPDAPNFTPRISGIVDLNDKTAVYRLSILKSVPGSDGGCTRNTFAFEKGIAGIAHCIHTYEGDGNPLPSFSGEPYPVPLSDSIADNAKTYWDHLNSENRVSLLVKKIDVKSGVAEITIVNKLS
ncbi:MAG TPA: IMP cyclohydrolase [Spirochaetota bacterium]|nr:IMP cyclohydrolase [Spirochaetota bacterium]